MIRKVGLTGGIGSGKTLIASIFEKLNIPVFYADEEAKLLITNDLGIQKEIKAEFGEDIYQQGKLDKEKFASIIFHEQEKLQKVHQIVHPRVREVFATWADKQNAPYVIMEAAILFESEGYKFMDDNVLVYAPEELRIERVINRDNATAEDVKARIRHQQPDEEKINKADWVLYNDGKKMVLPQIIELDKIFKEKNS
ncbi:MAG: dephospho-CoA kinase [Bacteroidales bacterium]